MALSLVLLTEALMSSGSRSAPGRKAIGEGYEAARRTAVFKKIGMNAIGALRQQHRGGDLAPQFRRPPFRRESCD